MYTGWLRVSPCSIDHHRLDSKEADEVTAFDVKDAPKRKFSLYC